MNGWSGHTYRLGSSFFIHLMGLDPTISMNSERRWIMALRQVSSQINEHSASVQSIPCDLGSRLSPTRVSRTTLMQRLSPLLEVTPISVLKIFSRLSSQRTTRRGPFIFRLSLLKLRRHSNVSKPLRSCETLLDIWVSLADNVLDLTKGADIFFKPYLNRLLTGSITLAVDRLVL